MRDLRMPVCVVAGVSGAVTVAVALFLPWPGFASRLPSLHVALDTALPLFALAAGLLVFGRLRQCARLDELTLGCSLGLLAISAVLASVAHVNYFLHPALYLHFSSVGDVFLLCFYLVLLAGPARETRSRWRATPQAAVLEERRRIARDLHDVAARELAYQVRNLDALRGTVDVETKAHLWRAAKRAELDIRLAIDEIAAPRSQSVNTAIAQAVGEVAARDHIKLELDVVPGVQLSVPSTDALAGIAREAVSNAARHSGATRVSLSLQHQGEGVHLRVSDDGSGFDVVAQADGFGLTSMRDRATLIGGDLWISSVPGLGTEVEVRL